MSGEPVQHPMPGRAAGRCPVCGSQEFAAFRFGLLRCKACSLVIDERIFQPELDRELNQDAFGEGYDPETSFWVRWFEAWKNRRYLANVRRAGVRQGKLLEVGVGSGSLLTAARGAGFEPEGCDLSASLARRVAAKTGIPVHCADLASLPAGAYDVVCMHHVLEHVSDPVGFLRVAAQRLHAGGVLHLALPNGAAWEAKLPGWNCYEYYHVAYYDADTLRRACEAAGMRVEWVGTHESFSAWFLAVVRTVLGVRPMERPRAGALGTGRLSRRGRLAEHAYRMAMVVAGVLSWPLRAVQERLGRGTELVAIARVGV